MFFNSKILKKEMGFPGGSDGKKKKTKQTNKQKKHLYCGRPGLGKIAQDC